MTELIYYQDQYVKELEADVIKVDGNRILLDRTILIPQTNTEPGDYGKINNIRIAGSKKESNDVWHVFPKTINFIAGQKVKLELDWTKRLQMMRMHSALHLLAGATDNKYGIRAVAGIVKSDDGYLVYKKEGSLSDGQLNEAIELANKDIETGIEIKSWFDKKREGFRWTQVGNYPPIPDGGLLVKNTKEIGKIVLVSNSFEEGKQKVVIKLENKRGESG